MKKIFFTLGLICLMTCAQVCSASVWEEKILSLLNAGNETEALNQLENWKSDHGEDDPQYWVIGGNIWFQIAITPRVAITELPEGQYRIGEAKENEVVIEDYVTGDAVGKITDGEPKIDAEDMQKAIAFIDEGVKRFPYRLDIFTGRAHLYRTMGDLDNELAALESLVKDPKPNKDGEYETGPGQKLNEELEAYQLSMLMGYAREHIQKQNKTDDEAADAVARLIMKTFPERPHGYNLLGALASYEGKWPEVQEWLLMALEKDPEDSLVIMNLGYCYEKMDEIESAIVQYQRIIGLGNDPKLEESARKRLSELQKE